MSSGRRNPSRRARKDKSDEDSVQKATQRELNSAFIQMEDVTHHILSYLDRIDLCNCSLVCKSWHDLAVKDDIWKNLVLKRFPKANIDKTNVEEHSMRFYMTMYQKIVKSACYICGHENEYLEKEEYCLNKWEGKKTSVFICKTHENIACHSKLATVTYGLTSSQLSVFPHIKRSRSTNLYLKIFLEHMANVVHGPEWRSVAINILSEKVEENPDSSHHRKTLLLAEMAHRKVRPSLVYSAEGLDFIKGIRSDISEVVDRIEERDFYGLMTEFDSIYDRILYMEYKKKVRSTSIGFDFDSMMATAEEEALMNWVTKCFDEGMNLESLFKIAPKTLHEGISTLFGDKKRKIDQETGPNKKQKTEISE